MSVSNLPTFHNGEINPIFNVSSFIENESNYVDTSSNQSISGNKSFINTLSALLFTSTTSTITNLSANNLTVSLIKNTQTSVLGTSQPFTIDYSTGQVFYIPNNIVLTSNFQTIITNLPTDATKTYKITLIYYQSSTTYISHEIKVSNTNGDYLVGSSSTYGEPLWSNGVQSINISPSFTIQEFIIGSISNTTETITQYCVSSLNTYY